MHQDFLAAVERYLTEAPDDAFLVIEDADGRFVQLAREDEGVVFDLPTNTLSPLQIARAQELLGGAYMLERAPLDDRHFAFRVRLPPDAEALAELSLRTFRYVYGEPRAPLNVVIDV